MGRDTAACIGLAAALVAREDPDGVMVVAPADQLIHPAEKLAAALEAACDVAERTGRIVTFGIKPTSPSVVYGYVQRGERLFEARQRPVYAVARFHEKPKREAAEEFLRRGDCYWNSGMFVWSVSTILAAIQRYRPALHGAIARISAALGTPKAENIIADEYSKLEKISIDYAVLEKADNVVIIEADFEWDDVGSWLALERHCKPDGDGNVVAGTHVGVDTRRCILAGEPGHVIATIGLSDAIVIHTPDATLVCNKAQAPEIKTLVAQLKAKGLEKHL
jgi:mannose-1-phosphate guanylyltransferase